MYGGVIALFAVIAVLSAVAVMRIRGVRSRPKGLAGRRELAAMAPQGIAARARELRPSLKGVDELHPDETGNLLGDLEPSGPELRSSYEDVELDLMAPRAGKSTGIAIPRVLRARGAVLLTSNKSDVYAVTRAEREQGRHGLDVRPAGHRPHPARDVVGHPRRLRTIEGARRLAGHFVASVNDDSVARRTSGSRPRRTP